MGQVSTVLLPSQAMCAGQKRRCVKARLAAVKSGREQGAPVCACTSVQEATSAAGLCLCRHVHLCMHVHATILEHM